MEYKHTWKVRKIQLIIIAALMLALAVYAAYSDYDGNLPQSIGEAFFTWILMTWMVGGIVSAFSKNGSWITNTVASVVSWGIIGAFGAFSSGESYMMAFAAVAGMLKLIIGLALLFGLFAVSIAVYPFSTVYYAIKSREEPNTVSIEETSEQ